MALKKLSYEKNWTRAEDFPAYEENERQVRADLQYHPDAIRDYLNDTLLPALEDRTAAGQLGAVHNGAAASVQTILDTHRMQMNQLADDLAELASGGVPAVIRSAAVTFDKDSWSTVDGMAHLAVSASDHRRENENFGYNLYLLADGTYRSGTWAAAMTCVLYNSDGSITLTAEEPYSGKIVFFGL